MAWFRKYDKMQNGRLPNKVSSSGTFVVTEKIHGANFSVRCNTSTGQVMFGRRSGIIDAGDDFYSFRSARLDAELTQMASCLARILMTAKGRMRILGLQWEKADIKHFAVYGELFGGSYPHPEVDSIPGIGAVQKGVWYSPKLEFMAFDLLIQAERIWPATHPRTEIEHFRLDECYVDYLSAQKACEESGFMFAEALLTGSLQQCLEFGERFSSQIPAKLRLPPLETPNFAEGIVIRAATATESCKRAMFKVKIPEFAESKIYQNNDWKKMKDGTHSSRFNEREQILDWEVCACITQNRLNNVLSKHGRVGRSDTAQWRAVLEAFKKDVLEDLREVLGGEIDALPKIVAGNLDRLARELIIEHVKSM